MHRLGKGFQELEEKRAEAKIAHLIVQILLMEFYDLHPELFESFEDLLTLIVAAAKGNVRAQERTEILLQNSEANTEEMQRFAAAIRCILAGERDWSRLTEGLDLANALTVVEVLKALAQSTNAWLFKAQGSAIEHERLLANIAAALKGDVLAQRVIEASLQKAEAGTDEVQRFAAAIRRILAGERNWNRLTEDLGLDLRDALKLLEVLETVAQTTIMASLPIVIQEAWKQANSSAFEQAFATLPLEEQQVVVEALSYLREWVSLEVILGHINDQEIDHPYA